MPNISESILTLSGMEYYEGKNKDRLDSGLAKKAEKAHTHTVSEITDFPDSMPASDVSDWAKAATKPDYTKDEVGLSNVDNTADVNKSVKHATSADSAANASKVNNHTVESDVPANAVFTDTWIPFVGATADNPGTAGYIPAPSAGDQEKFFCGDGTYKEIKATNAHGFVNQDEEPANQSTGDEWLKDYE